MNSLRAENNWVKGTQYLRGCGSEKIVPAFFLRNYHKLFINRNVITVKIREKIHYFGHAFGETKEAAKGKTIDCHSSELIEFASNNV